MVIPNQCVGEPPTAHARLRENKLISRKLQQKHICPLFLMNEVGYYLSLSYSIESRIIISSKFKT